MLVCLAQEFWRLVLIKSIFLCTGDVLTEQQTGQLLRVIPQREGHRLDLQWAVPPEQHVYRATPCGYLGHLIG